MSFYQCHVFCCTNQRGPDAKRPSCAGSGSEALQSYMKKRVKELGINTQANPVRINKSGCLDRCELGPVMVIYPEGAWYHYASEADVDEILQSHVINKTPVARLLLANDQCELREEQK